MKRSWLAFSLAGVTALVSHGVLAAEPVGLGSEQIAMVRLQTAMQQLQNGQAESGRAALAGLIDDLPYTEGARRAFALARTLYRQIGGAEMEADFLLGVASRLAWLAEPGACSGRLSARSLLAEALVEVGRIRLHERDTPEGAVRILLGALPIAHDTAWEDDVLIWLARGLRQLGKSTEALARYQELIATQQLARRLGVAVSGLYDHALYEMGQLLEEQRRFAEAEVVYCELLRHVPASDLHNDAATRVNYVQARQRVLRETILGTQLIQVSTDQAVLH